MGFLLSGAPFQLACQFCLAFPDQPRCLLDSQRARDWTLWLWHHLDLIRLLHALEPLSRMVSNFMSNDTISRNGQHPTRDFSWSVARSSALVGISKSNCLGIYPTLCCPSCPQSRRTPPCHP